MGNDTLFSYDYFVVSVCTGDTSIEGDAYWVIHNTSMEPGPFSVYSDKATTYVHIGDDSVVVYEKGDAYSFTVFGPFKRAAYVPSYDTTMFYDRRVPLKFPLVQGTRWFMRSPDDPSALPTQKEFIGIDTVCVPAGCYEAWKVTWSIVMVDETIHYEDGSEHYEWWSNFGLVKMFNVEPKTGDLANSTSTTVRNEWSIEYVSSMPQNLPPVSPWLSQKTIDSVYAAIWQDWSWQRYYEWLSMIVDSCETSPICDPERMETLLWDVQQTTAATWNIDTRNWSFETVLSYLDTVEFPNAFTEIYDPEEFAIFVCNTRGTVPGWSDYVFDMEIMREPIDESGFGDFGVSAKCEQLEHVIYEPFK